MGGRFPGSLPPTLKPERIKMGIQRYAISREWMLRVLKALDGKHTKFTMPEDAEIIDAEYRNDQRLFMITCRSEEFSEVTSPLNPSGTSDVEVISARGIYSG